MDRKCGAKISLKYKDSNIVQIIGTKPSGRRKYRLREERLKQIRNPQSYLVIKNNNRLSHLPGCVRRTVLMNNPPEQYPNNLPVEFYSDVGAELNCITERQSAPCSDNLSGAVDSAREGKTSISLCYEETESFKTVPDMFNLCTCTSVCFCIWQLDNLSDNK